MGWLNTLSRLLLAVLIGGALFAGGPGHTAHAASCGSYEIRNSFGPNPIAQGEILYAHMNLRVVLDDGTLGQGRLRFRAVTLTGNVVADTYIGMFNSSSQTQHIPVWTPLVTPGNYTAILIVETACGTHTIPQQIKLLY